MRKKTTIVLTIAGTLACTLLGSTALISAAEGRLTPTGVAASSTLSGGDYDAYNLIDNDLSTAWVEGAAGDGIGEFVDFFFPAGTTISGGVIYPAYYKNQDIFEKNSGVTKITLQSGSDIREIDCSSAAQSMVSGGYTFTLSSDMVCDGTVRVKIQSVRNGWKYEDTCISELYFFGGSAGSLNGSSGSSNDSGNSSGNGHYSGSPTSDGEPLFSTDLSGVSLNEQSCYDLASLAQWAYRRHVSDSEVIDAEVNASDLTAEDKDFLLFWYTYNIEDSRVEDTDNWQWHYALTEDLIEIGQELFGQYTEAELLHFLDSYAVDYKSFSAILPASGDFGAVGPIYFDKCEIQDVDKENGRIKVGGAIKVFNSSGGLYEDGSTYEAWYRITGDAAMDGWRLESVKVETK